MTLTRQKQNVFTTILHTTTALAPDSANYWTKATEVYFPADTNRQTDRHLSHYSNVPCGYINLRVSFE
jgi:hypothetical protein